MYLLDANVFIEAKGRYYSFDICPGFWTWINRQFPIGDDVASIVKVYDELTDGNDTLAEWIKNRKNDGFFLSVSDESTQSAFKEIATTVQNGPCTAAAKANFLSKADPWLIAKALAIGATVVTHEQPAPEARKRVLIPNICEDFGVSYVNTFDMLRKMKVSFALDINESQGHK